MLLKRMVLAGLVLASAAAPASAGEGKFSALTFGDVYWVAANHDSTIEDMNGLWIRRVNLTYDHKFDDTYSARLRLEAAQPGDFETTPTVPSFVKDAWVKWQKRGQAVLIGVQPAPALLLYEDIWGYRAVEKVPVELQGLETSRDGGVAATGDFGEEKVFGYYVMVGNGTHVNAETNTKKKGAVSLRFRPVEGLVLEAYGDYEDRVESADRATYYGFAGYQTDRLRAGAQYAQQTRNEVGEDVELRIISGFVAGRASDRLWLFGRVDRNMDPNPGGASIQYIPFDPNAANTFFTGGLDFAVAEGVNLIPNVEAVVYDEPEAGGETPDADVILRLTFQGKF
jgi:hypothetical protein